MASKEELKSQLPGKLLFVAAIDFGTTFSGYAFSSKAEWFSVNTNNWKSGELISQKTPTALLLNPDKSFNSFGYDAENQYMRLAQEAEENRKDGKSYVDYSQYYYFHRFKMVLHQNQNISRTMLLEDETGKSMEASTVFTHSIRYIKDHLLETIGQQCSGVDLNDILYVITVPAIWDDKAKMFMREAATKAGIPSDQLKIALEPEAASIYCQYEFLNTERDVDPELKEKRFYDKVQAEKSYMVVDLGGGTADITVHKKCGKTNTLEEVIPASGGQWGGKSVDDAFLTFLEDICGRNLFQKFKREHMEDYIYLSREFEIKKRSLSGEKSSKIYMKVPLVLRKMVEADKKTKMLEVIKASQYMDTVQFTSACKFQWNDVANFKTFFDRSVEGIITHINAIFQENDNIRDLSTIVLVGGFSECDLVLKELKSSFENETRKVVCPSEPGLAVLKGAVFFGHMSNVISRRVSRYTYGIQSWPEFNELKHPQSNKVILQGIARCKNVFFKMVEKGQHLKQGHKASQVFQALKPEEDKLECAVYISEKKNPQFINESGCRLLGTLEVPLQLQKGQRVEIEETLIFGETELKVQAKNVYTNTIVEVTFDLLKDK